MRMVKKMVSAATITVFLFCCYFISSSGSQDDCVYAATGSTFTVPLKYKLKGSESLRWLKDTSVVFHRRQKQVITGNNDDVDSTGSLKLTQLTKDKSGRYTPEVTSAEGINVGDLPSMRLCVLDSVKKPTVTMTCIGAQKHVSFTCNAGQGETIKWLMNDKPLAEKGKTVTRVAKDVANTHFSCNVSNIVSSEISLPVQQNCYKLAFPDVCDIDVCIPVRTGAGILLLVILTVIVCCTHKKAKVIKEKDELPLKQHHHHQKQLVGSFPEPDFCADCGLEGDNGI